MRAAARGVYLSAIITTLLILTGTVPEAGAQSRTYEARSALGTDRAQGSETAYAAAHRVPDRIARLIKRTGAHRESEARFLVDRAGDLFWISDSEVPVGFLRSSADRGDHGSTGTVSTEQVLVRRAPDGSETPVRFPLEYAPAVRLLDTQPPAVVSASVSPSTVDVTDASANIDVQARLTDDDTGTDFVMFILVNTVTAEELSGIATLTSGTALDGTWQSSVFIPRFTTPGTWRLDVFAWDVAFNSTTVQTSESIEIIGQADTTPPTATSSPVIDPPSVDLSSGPRSVTVQIGLADDASGVSFVDMGFRLGTDVIEGFFSTLVSGTPLDGVWESTIEIPQNAATGDWTLWVDAWDSALNNAEINTGATLSVQGGDTVAPTLTGTVVLDPTSISVVDGDGTVLVTAPVSDADTGVEFVDILYQRGIDVFYGGAATLVSGDVASGTWESSTIVPQATPTGTWEVLVGAGDVAGNYVEISSGSFLTVTASDSQAPSLAGVVAIDPTSVNVAGGSQVVTATAPLQDDIAGVEQASIILELGFDRIVGDPMSLISGDPLNGVWEGTVEVPVDAADGTWTVLIAAADSALNYSELPTGLTLEISGTDSQAPSVVGTPTADPSNVDVSGGPVNVAVSGRLSDPGSGVIRVDYSLTLGPSLGASAAASLASGDAQDGVWEAELVIPWRIEDGQYQLIATAEDAATNISTTPTGVFVTISGGDLVAPQLNGSPALSPGEVDITDGPGESRITIPLTDAGSGVNTVVASLRSGASIIQSTAASLFSGTAAQGVWEAVFAVEVAGGTYDVEIQTIDLAGNSTNLAGPVLTVILPLPGAVGSPSPFEGEVQVARRPTLFWTSASGARTYDVFLWPQSEARPGVPLATTSRTEVISNIELTYETAYSWQIVATNPSGSTEGPVWTFTTLTVPDLVVSAVQVPSSAQSGQTIQIQWTVTNVGSTGTTASSWKDRLVFSADLEIDFLFDEAIGRFDNISFLGAGESYTNTTTFTLPRRTFGLQNVLVVVDDTKRQAESDETNNLGFATIQVDLPPPPDLSVTSITAPGQTFSGSEINVEWTVRNGGPGFTDTNTWRDRVYLSTSDTLDREEAVRLATFVRRSLLAPDSSYAASAAVNLPDGISGSYFIHFATDDEDDVFEQTGESNNEAVHAVAVVLAPPPDLIVDVVTPPTSGSSGRSVEIQWTVRNAGPGATKGSWEDRLYLSASPSFDPQTATVLRAFGNVSDLEPDGTYGQTKSVKLPDGIEGPYYVHVHADWKNDVFEHTFDDNNVTSSAPLQVELSPWPDLVPSNVILPSQATASEEVSVSWRNTNSGVATAVAPWRDSLFVSQASSWDRSRALPVGALPSGSSLDPTASIARSTRVRFPASVSGVNYLYVMADGSRQVFEHTDEGNNVVRSAAIDVAPRPLPDLVVETLVAPGTAEASRTIRVDWTVRNNGPGSAPASRWRDVVAVSADEVFQLADDFLASSAVRNEPLDPGASYSRSREIVVPLSFSGDYFVLVATDFLQVAGDSDYTNNTRSVPISITSFTAPDLEVVDLSVPASAQSGQPITVSWTVRNTGGGDAQAADRWADAVYLSSDASLEKGDARLAGVAHSGPLATGESYRDSTEIVLPPHTSGPVYLIVRTNDSRSVTEATADNNVARAATNAILAPPADLIVSEVTADAQATVGNEITVGWTLRNVGQNAATGRLTQGVYMSADTLWQVSDLLLGTRTSSIDLSPGGQSKMSATFSLAKVLEPDSTGNLTSLLRGLVPGDYFGLVRADVLNNIRESREGNNTGTGSTTAVVVPEMVLGVDEIGTWNAGEFKLYRIEVGEGLDLMLTLEGGSFVGNSIFVSFGSVPTPSRSDYSNTDLSTLSRRLVVPSTQAGTYYVLITAQANDPANAGDSYQLGGEAVGFSVSGVSPSRGGTPGRVTVDVAGAGFRLDSQVLLRSASRTVTGELREFRNTTDISARFDLTGVPVGTYDVLVRNSDASEAVLAGAFAVEPALPAELELVRTTPDNIRALRPNPYVFRFSNISNVDIDFTSVQIEMPSDAIVKVNGIRGLLRRSAMVPASQSEQLGPTEDFIIAGPVLLIPLVARDIAPGETVEVQLTIEANRGPTEFPIGVGWQLMDEATFVDAQLQMLERLRLEVESNPSAYSAEFTDVAADPAAFLERYLAALVEIGLLDAQEAESIPQTSLAASSFVRLGLLRQELMGSASQEILLLAAAGPCEAFFDLVGCGLAVVGCVTGPVTFVGFALCGIGISSCLGVIPGEVGCVADAASGNVAGVVNCIAKEVICNSLVFPMDPNDILGPPGYGDPRWVPASRTMGYTIRFENDPEIATAPAQEVRITQELDPDIDERTFRLGPFGFAGLDFTVPPNRAAYTARLDVTDSLGVFVDVTAGVDVTTRRVFWTFSSVDERTGQPPTDPFAGFLAVNDSLGSGEGYVTYSVRPRRDAATGDVVDAEARIFFDQNDPIDTPAIFNTLDADAPSSRLASASEVGPGLFDLIVEAQDGDGSGVRDFALYAAVADSSFAPVETAITRSPVTFATDADTRYRFFSVATDNAGNVEDAKSAAEVVVSIDKPTEDLPTAFALHHGYPNPFNPTTIIPFDVPEASRIEIRVFDAIGRLVRLHQVGDLSPGRYEYRMNMASSASGVYFYELRATRHGAVLHRQVRSVVLVK